MSKEKLILLQKMKKITDKKYKVLVVHYIPFDPKYGLGKTKEEIEEMGGVFVTEIPEPERIGGKYPIRYWDPIKKEIFYEYEENIENKENIPGSKEELQEERLTKVENDITILQNSLVEQQYNELMKGVK